MLCYTYETGSHSVKLALWVGVLGCGDTPVKLDRGYVFFVYVFKMSLGLKHFVLEGVM